MKRGIFRKIGIYIFAKNIEFTTLAIVGLVSIIWFIYPDNSRLEPSVAILASFFAFLATRKVILNKNYPKILQKTIANSNPHTDWYVNETGRNNEHIAVYKKDPSIKIIVGREPVCDDFNESWMDGKFIDMRAASYQVYIEYGGNEIDSFTVLFVDGGRGYIPLPTLPSLETNSYKVAVCQVLTQSEHYDTSFYIKSSQIKVEDIYEKTK
jgi:hypothetical protein